MTRTLALMLAIAPLTLAACMQDRPADRPAVSPAAKVIGAPMSCLSLTQFQETRIRDDWTIDFIGAGNRAWRNTLPQRCPGLTSDNAITYETSLTQLCNVDIVYPLRNIGGTLQQGPGCGLGHFVPIRLEPRR